MASMPDQIELQQQIEALATRIVLEDWSPENADDNSLLALSAAVRGVRDRAQANGYQEVSRIAAELCEALDKPDGTQDLSSAVQNGVIAMQQAVEKPPVEVPTADPKSGSLAEDPELLGDFVLESREHLATVENRSLALEQDPSNSEAIHAIFRAFHTIKGLAGFLELDDVREVSHNVETVLDKARNGELTITSQVIDVVLASADYLKTCVDSLDSSLHGHEPLPVVDNARLLDRIRGLMSGARPDTGPDTAPGAEMGTAFELSRQSASEAEHPGAASRPQTIRTEAAAVKVDTSKLDYLVDMAGELVIAQSMVRHDPDLASLKSARLQRNLAQLARITSELQKTSMSMRLVPIGHLFQRVARQVRDLARKVGKPAELDISGAETEIDRTIVEELADPLMHMVRNSLDHGVEDPGARAAAGKPPVARIGLRASHQAGHIVIAISDDGRGLDAERILAKAMEKGLVGNPEQLSEADVFHLIFEPGFSTAQKITEVSGRGVGMDVVRKQIQKLRGHIEIHSTAGVGTTFTLNVPLTLAIIDGLVVAVGAERYIVPLFAVREMFRPAAENIFTVQSRGEMVMVRGNLLPVVRLYGKFGVKPRSVDPCRNLLIVAEGASHRFCLMVDELIGKQEVVIKSLGDAFKNVSGVAGGAILGDGRVGLILDLAGLFRAGHE
jgi:two-component system chemotaxis sensor kinase CheA